MAKYQLRIELLSDMCTADGSVYNSMIDTDSCYDEFGLPFIPAKRIKGCLRECALELNEWGYINPETKMPFQENAIFGEAGRDSDMCDQRGRVRFSNAYLENYIQMKEEILSNRGNPLYHQQLVLNQFSYIRTQTALNQETGIADETYLRTIRVINKGLVFVADVEMPEEHFLDMKACCEILEHIGIARTRGLGEVRVSIKPSTDTSKVVNHASLNPETNYLFYELTVKEPVICRSVSGGESRTLDYIEGSKILGAVLSGIRAEKGNDYVKAFVANQGIYFSNAYIGKDGRRFTEIPAYIFGIKNNKNDYVNRIANKQNYVGFQLNPLKHCYSILDENNLYTMNVNVEERYHHRRPLDKSIGRAITSKDNSDFYQMSGICSDQKFYGFILGDEKLISMAYKAIVAYDSHYIGYARSAEYGKTCIRILDALKLCEDKLMSDRIIVILEAPAILYNDKAMYTIDKNELVKQVCLALDIDHTCVANFESYVNYTTIGGFNVTWGFRKPIISAFDKGSTVVLTLNKAIEVCRVAFIGERNMEGFGEISVLPCVVNDKNETLKLDPKSSDYKIKALEALRSGSILTEEGNKRVDNSLFIKKGSLGDNIAKSLYASFLNTCANQSDMVKNAKIKMRPTISNMLVDFRYYDSIEQVQAMVDDRFGEKGSKKEEKLRFAQEILEEAKTGYNNSKSKFCKIHNIEEWEWQEKDGISDEMRYQLLYLQELLIAMKYSIRAKNKEGK